MKSVEEVCSGAILKQNEELRVIIRQQESRINNQEEIIRRLKNRLKMMNWVATDYTVEFDEKGNPYRP